MQVRTHKETEMEDSTLLQVRTHDQERKWRVVEVRTHMGEEVERLETPALDVLEACRIAQERRTGYTLDGWEDNGIGSQFNGQETVSVFVTRMEKLEPNGG